MCVSPKGLNRLDYSILNSFGFDPRLFDCMEGKDTSNKLTNKIPAAQNVNAQRPSRGRGPAQRGCPRRCSHPRDQCKTAKYPPTSHSNPTAEYSEYITVDEWTASEDELRTKIEIEKAKLHRKSLLSDLAGIRADKAGITSGPFSGGPSRQRGHMEETCHESTPRDDVSQRVSSRSHGVPGHGSSSDEYAVNDYQRRGKRRKYRKNKSGAKSGMNGSKSSADSKVGKYEILEHLIEKCPDMINSQTSQSQQLSGIHDSFANSIVVAKQKFPHSQLQQECLWGYSGENIHYENLTLGLFIAGELEIISDPHTDPKEAIRRLEMLKVTAYRSQYLPWSKLLHLHAAILKKIESGKATWESNFDSIEKMVLENPGHVDWGQRLSFNSSHASDGDSAPRRDVFWCWDFNKSSCGKHHQHHAVVNGDHVSVKHICASCYHHDRSERFHPENSLECPWSRGPLSDDS